ncbi:MAG: type II toxin-antitoxin system prevent-host-death family antitoxin [Hyphomonadaceae bacterium]|nr:type II toxin-antitoxin system prevent-host-death family antitoxin [Hyphomonadaceae bacterium]
MSTWQLQTAKAKLSELLRAVRDHGPQTISVRGREEYVVLRKEDAPAQDARRVPKTWDELYASVEGAGESLVLPPREPEPLRNYELAETVADWQEED